MYNTSTQQNRIHLGTSVVFWCLTQLSTLFQLSWFSALLVEESGIHGENHGHVTSH